MVELNLLLDFLGGGAFVIILIKWLLDNNSNKILLDKANENNKNLESIKSELDIIKERKFLFHNFEFEIYKKLWQAYILYLKKIKNFFPLFIAYKNENCNEEESKLLNEKKDEYFKAHDEFKTILWNNIPFMNDEITQISEEFLLKIGEYHKLIIQFKEDLTSEVIEEKLQSITKELTGLGEKYKNGITNRVYPAQM